MTGVMKDKIDLNALNDPGKYPEVIEVTGNPQILRSCTQ
jgi:hypothetical protein